MSIRKIAGAFAAASMAAGCQEQHSFKPAQHHSESRNAIGVYEKDLKDLTHLPANYFLIEDTRYFALNAEQDVERQQNVNVEEADQALAYYQSVAAKQLGPQALPQVLKIGTSRFIKNYPDSIISANDYMSETKKMADACREMLKMQGEMTP